MRKPTVRRSCLVLVVLGIAALSSGPAWCQNLLLSPGGSGTAVDNVILQVDNDLFSGSDRDYTSGVRLACGGPLPSEEINGWLRGRLRRLLGEEGSYPLFERLAGFPEWNEPEYGWGTSLSQLLFTPADHLTPVPPPGERPYAAWLGVEISVLARDEVSLSSATLSLGVTGEWALGEVTQDFIHHEISHSPYFNGWDSQMPEEVTLNLHLDHKRRLCFLDDWRAGGFGVDGYYEFGGALGNLRTAAYAGALLRAGWNLRGTYAVPRLELGSFSNQFFRGASSAAGPFTAYLLAGLRGSAVLHDITLDGPLFTSHRHTVNSKPWVGEVIVGAGLAFHQWELVYSRTIRTDEFEGQRSNHGYGSMQLRWVREF